jgi:hypothetical protein
MGLQSERGVNLEQGEVVTLFTSAARGAAPAGVTGDAVQINGERLVYTWILDITNAATDGTDTLDVYIDTLFGTATWINIVHFTQILGNGADAITRFVTTVPANMLTTDDATAACAVGVARGVVGSQFRGRYVEVDGGGAASTFTFSLTGYAQ